MRLGAVLLSASLALGAADARANGRFPLSQRLLQDPEHPERLYVSATFGLLASSRAEAGFFYICERAFASAVREADPLLELLPGGAVLASVVQPLGRSSDCGCGWEPVLGADAGDWVMDITRREETVLAVVRSAGPPIRYRLERSTDAGRTFSKLSDLPPGLDELAPPAYDVFTIDIAPSDPMRVYLSLMIRPELDAGVELAVPGLARSNDGGLTFEVRPIAGAGNADYPYLAAVHPTNADALYIRSDAWREDPDFGIDVGDDALFFSDDGGSSFSELLRRGAKLFGFALSPDGTTVLAGYGDPVRAATATYTEDLGIYRASVGDHVFEQALNAPVSCLTWNEHGLYVCLEERHPDLAAPFGIGVSQDGSLPGAVEGFTPLLRFADVRGPLACHVPACLEDWQVDSEAAVAACLRLGAECDVDPSAHAIACEAGTGGTAGGTGMAGSDSGGAMSGGASGAGALGGVGSGMGGTSGAATAGGSASGAPAGGGTPGTESGSKSNCGCRTPGHSRTVTPFWLLVVVAAITHARRKFRLSPNFPSRATWRKD